MQTCFEAERFVRVEVGCENVRALIGRQRGREKRRRKRRICKSRHTHTESQSFVGSCRTGRPLLLLLMETVEESDLCFPHLLNTSCRKIHYPVATSVFIRVLLSFVSPLTAIFNLLVIVSISHFRCFIFFSLSLLLLLLLQSCSDGTCVNQATTTWKHLTCVACVSPQAASHPHQLPSSLSGRVRLPHQLPHVVSNASA